MEQVLEFIKKNNLIKSEDIIGVGVSGGRDSMALLHYLNSIKDQLDCQVIAINIDHCIRANSAMDSAFVLDYCKDNGIRSYRFRVDSIKIANEQKLTLEQSARQGRYGVFESLISKGVVTKIALAHHISDQAETILLNIFRGSGLSGAKGMEAMRDGIYIRPFLDTTRADIEQYISENDIPYVDDETNTENEYTRNYLRNVVMPLIKHKFGNVEKNIVNFGKICEQDEKYIYSQINMASITTLNKVTRIPLSYFNFAPSIINRIVYKVLNNYSKNVGNIEKKHINIVCDFAREGSNGTVIALPNGIKVYKEYDFITVSLSNKAKITANHKFKKGLCSIEGYGNIRVKGTKTFGESNANLHFVDADTIPETAEWRYRKDGDIFQPLGNGTKKLKDYFIDKKVPKRLRDTIPVLAIGNEILVVANIEISDKVKVTENTKNMYKLVYDKILI